MERSILPETFPEPRLDPRRSGRGPGCAQDSPHPQKRGAPDIAEGRCADEEGAGDAGLDWKVDSPAEGSHAEPATPKGGLTKGLAALGCSAKDGLRRIRSYAVCDQRFEVDARYSLLDVVGQGAYGIVCAAKDERTGAKVAIKKIGRAFEHSTYTRRTLREIRLLRLLKHENLIGVRTVLLPVDLQGFDDLYVVSDLMETDLSSIIKSSQPLSDMHAQFFLYQILRGVKFLHSANVVHRDIKPRNLLVNSNCDLKICDFGLARVSDPNITKARRSSSMTDYVATRWYRSPEVILGLPSSNSKPLDVWSIGCVLGELLGRKPLFPGKDSGDQLRRIAQVVGTPRRDAVAAGEGHDEMARLVDGLPRLPPRPFAEIFPDSNPDACDMLDRLLAVEPESRIAVEDALAHGYLESFHCPEDEPCGPCLSKHDFSFENCTLSTRQLREEIIHEVLVHHRDRRIACAPRAR